MSADSKTFHVIMLEADTEIVVMHMLAQVMRHMTDYESMTEPQRHRIATWFASRYGAQHSGDPV